MIQNKFDYIPLNYPRARLPGGKGKTNVNYIVNVDVPLQNQL